MDEFTSCTNTKSMISNAGKWVGGRGGGVRSSCFCIFHFIIEYRRVDGIMCRNIISDLSLPPYCTAAAS